MADLNRRKRLHELVDFKEELREQQVNLEHEELQFATAIRNRTEILNKSSSDLDDPESDNEDQFLENLRISEETIHHHRQKMLEIQSKILDIKENIMSLEILVKLDEVNGGLQK